MKRLHLENHPNVHNSKYQDSGGLLNWIAKYFHLMNFTASDGGGEMSC